jgi:hypothetical protein
MNKLFNLTIVAAVAVLVSTGAFAQKAGDNIVKPSVTVSLLINPGAKLGRQRTSKSASAPSAAAFTAQLEDAFLLLSVVKLLFLSLAGTCNNDNFRRRTGTGYSCRVHFRT